MAFAVVCKSCHARFLLNDDLLRRKVAGRVVTVRCRQCHATIEVDASDVDPKTLPEIERPMPPRLPPKGAKMAPSPPRPIAKSTLMGIGGPPRPGAETELVALSAGFLNMSVPTPAAPGTATLHGYPEPPPPPGAVEELTSGDWEVAETAPVEAIEEIPESVDEFMEELPSSIPPADEEAPPSSSGIPSLKALTHHDASAPKRRPDDFLANMSAAMNGGIMPDAGGAPTIDVSTLTATAGDGSSVSTLQVPAFDMPREGKSTLPLFALSGGSEPASPAPAQGSKGLARPPASGAAGTLARATPTTREPEAADSVRERKNVVAPASKSTPPPAARAGRSGLAAPILLVLAVAAGFLIYSRSRVPADAQARAEQPTPGAVEAAKLAAPAPAPAAPEPIASAALAPTDAVAFESTITKPVPLAAASTNAAAVVREKPTTTSPSSAPTTEAGPAEAKPAEAKPAEAKPAEAKPEQPAQPIAAPEPAAPEPPAAPAGPFDRAAAAAALNTSAAQASSCRKEGDPSGVASVVITFAPSGRVTSANVSGPPFAGTATGGCIAAALRKAKVPPFDGDRVTVSKTISIQ